MNEETKQIGDQETQIAEVVRLPLWKACVDSMLAAGVSYGQIYTAEFFEESLKCRRDEMQFGLAVSEIRRSLETKGFYLSGRGFKGDSFVILEPNKNRDVMKSYATAALDALKRGVILGTNTRMDLLSGEDRRKHESALEKMATRLVLMQRPKTFANLAKKNGAKLLAA